MNNTNANAEAYVQTFWPEKPKPIKSIIKLAYIAGMNDLRGQAAISALQGLLSNPECIGTFVLREQKEVKPAVNEAAQWAVTFANALIDKLNTRG